jgi:iron complex outermembrane receptor protein
VRFPKVSELYQGAATSSGISNIANPDLRPERSWTSELSSEWTLPDAATLRLTLFHEDTHDALYSQPLPNVTPVTNSVQNVDHVRTTGLEAAAQRANVLWRGLDLQGSVTYADSKIVANSGYVSTPGDTVGKWQPRVPRWRASALAAWRADERWTVSYGARYSGRQYGSLDNSDTNGFTYMGTSKYFTTDLRVRFAIDRQWHAAFGIDNLNNYQYWNFHPYPQRTYSAELRYDL